MLTSSSTPQAETLIRSTNARVTKTRVKVLDYLLSHNRSQTHHEIQQALSQDSDIDSVTLYRVLEWLTENELVHRIAGADQVWRFSAGAGHQAHEHAHFQCTRCADVTCFNEVKLPAPVANKTTAIIGSARPGGVRHNTARPRAWSAVPCHTA